MQPGQGGRRLGRHHLPHEGPHRPPQLQGPARAVAVPERHLARQPGGGGDDHPVVGDVLDAPGAGPQQERLAGAGLVDHLLVELAHPGPVGQEHAVEAAVGDGAAAGDGQPLGPRAAPHDALHPVPDDPGPQLGELVGRVAAGQQVEGGRAGRRRTGRRSWPPPGPGGPGRRGASRPWRRRPRSAGPARRAGCGGSGSPRSGPGACGRPPPPPPADRPDAWGRTCPGWARPPGGRPGPPAAGPGSPPPATRPGSPDRPPPCRCRAPATRWPPGP